MEVVTWSTESGAFTSINLPSTGHWGDNYDETNPPDGLFVIKYYM